MGLLDDAIRQHLDLKRAHGADEAELKRKEDEALGPVRRETEPAADNGGEEAAVHEQPPAEEAVAPEPAPEPPPIAEEPVADALPEEPAAFTDDDPFGDDEPFAEEPAAEEPFAPEELPAPEPPAASSTPTRGFDALSEDALEDEPGHEPAAADAEDVLEETPEFLQETPEHDRLWFEQKPPRDFDFDDEK